MSLARIPEQYNIKGVHKQDIVLVSTAFMTDTFGRPAELEPEKSDGCWWLQWTGENEVVSVFSVWDWYQSGNMLDSLFGFSSRPQLSLWCQYPTQIPRIQAALHHKYHQWMSAR